MNPYPNDSISGKIWTKYQYTFNAVDPDGDDVKYIIDWADGNYFTTSFNQSGTDVTVSHTWSKSGTCIITAKAEDSNGLIGPDGELPVAMLRIKASYDSCGLSFLERFPLLQKLANLVT